MAAAFWELKSLIAASGDLRSRCYEGTNEVQKTKRNQRNRTINEMKERGDVQIIVCREYISTSPSDDLQLERV